MFLLHTYSKQLVDCEKLFAKYDKKCLVLKLMAPYLKHKAANSVIINKKKKVRVKLKLAQAFCLNIIKFEPVKQTLHT